MSQPDQPLDAFEQQLHRLPGVKDVVFRLQDLSELTADELPLPGPYADLPHAPLWRSRGGAKGEWLVTAELRFFQNHSGWIALEFLSWWARDLARSGVAVQVRAMGLPPVLWGTQLGRTLRVALEFFVDVQQGNPAKVVNRQIGEWADFLKEQIDDYAEVIRKPTKAEWRTIEQVKICAGRNDPVAMITLADLYSEGRDDLPPDESAAYELYAKAAELGHPEGKMQAGSCLADGFGVKPNLPAAVALYREAAEAGLPQAMGLLGQCYDDGAGIEADPAEAAKWFERGAELDDPLCLTQLGEHYEHGKGVPVNRAKALQLYQQAFTQGYEDAHPGVSRLSKELGLEEA